MSHRLPDVDIDFADREQVLSALPAIAASMNEHGVVKKHNTGVYYTQIPVDPATNMSTLDYKIAEDRGYFKLDLLNVAVYQKVKDEAHLDKLIKQEPLWELLWKSKEFCEQVIHIGNYHDLIKKMKPDSIPRMAMLLSIIRPGKANLQGKTWKEVSESVWNKPEGGAYYFKKAHAVAYAHLVAVHINLLCEEYK
tara:strand:+ start:34408 stop:34989 length:582 start_codon:yes stop_codon:yes gene_type:complete